MAAPNAVTASYLAQAATRPGPASELAGLAAGRVDLAATSYAGRCLSRPVFLEQDELSRLRDDVSQLHAALTSLPGRLFGGDLAAFARAAGMPEVQVAAIARGSGGTPTRMCRADLYRAGAGFQAMEINMGTAIGGLDNALLNQAWLAQPFLADFAAAHRLAHADTMGALVSTLLAECGLEPGSGALIAAADWPASFATLEPRLWHSARQLAGYGIEVVPCHLGQLAVSGGRVWLDHRPVQVIYRIFMVEDLLDPAGPALIDPLLRAAERGEVRLFAPMDAELYASKGALALLSDESSRAAFSDAELASLDRILPWTRLVRSGPVSVAGQQADLSDYAMAQQEELILKPVSLHGGSGVVPGWLTEPGEWARQLKAAMDGPYVLQRRIRPEPELFPAGAGPGPDLEPWTLTWGIFLGTGGYAGAFVRGSAEPGGGVVNMATGATATCCFHQQG
ncbi:MAG TPA: hypothetical protein VH637_06945 [Streptosporangiaceae bacterium]|jgi:hypothetical protein